MTTAAGRNRYSLPMGAPRYLILGATGGPGLGTFLHLAREGAELMPDTIDQGWTWLAAPADPPYGRGMNLQIWTRDAAALYAHVISHGGPIFMELEEKLYRCDDSYSGSRQFIVQDPDGYLLRFAEDIGQQRRETPDFA